METSTVAAEEMVSRGPSEEWRYDKLVGKVDVTRRQIGVRLCEILGLNPGTVRDMHLHLPVGGHAIVTLDRYVSHDEADEIVIMLESYTLAPREENSQPSEDA